MPPEKVESFGEQAPIGRAGQPAELAPAYVFLASQESSYVTGETLAVTGGTPLHWSPGPRPRARRCFRPLGWSPGRTGSAGTWPLSVASRITETVWPGWASPGTLTVAVRPSGRPTPAFPG